MAVSLLQLTLTGIFADRVERDPYTALASECHDVPRRPKRRTVYDADRLLSVTRVPIRAVRGA
eukprot:1029719-Prymnesium_polylepis.1